VVPFESLDTVSYSPFISHIPYGRIFSHFGDILGLGLFKVIENGAVR